MQERERREPLDERHIMARLDVLNPRPANEPDVSGAWLEMRRRLTNAPEGKYNSVVGRWTVNRNFTRSRWWMPALAGVMVIVLLGVLFSFASVRQAAADFLSIFRVQKITAIPISPEQWAAQEGKLENLAQMMEQGFLGEPTVLREPGDPVRVTNADEASSLAGFRVLVPGYVPNGSTLKEFSVAVGPAIHYEVKRAKVQSVLELLGVTDVSLPDVEKLVVEADIPNVVLQEYRVPESSGIETRFAVYQVYNPTATVEPAVDPAVFGEAALRALGVPAEEARRLAGAIDWTSTLVIPVPVNLAEFREVSVNGAAGIMLTEVAQQAGEPMRTLLWQKDKVMYMVAGRLRGSELLHIAESLR
ncbi:MAG: DUF4367 domain-containing protein [Anaerolineae bacterium]